MPEFHFVFTSTHVRYLPTPNIRNRDMAIELWIRAQSKPRRIKVASRATAQHSHGGFNQHHSGEKSYRSGQGSLMALQEVNTISNHDETIKSHARAMSSSVPSNPVPAVSVRLINLTNTLSVLGTELAWLLNPFSCSFFFHFWNTVLQTVKNERSHRPHLDLLRIPSNLHIFLCSRTTVFFLIQDSKTKKLTFVSILLAFKRHPVESSYIYIS